MSLFNIINNDNLNAFNQQKSIGFKYIGNFILERNGKANYLSINSLPEFSSLSFEEIKYRDYMKNKSEYQNDENNFQLLNSQTNKILLKNNSSGIFEDFKKEKKNDNENNEIKDNSNNENNSEDNKFNRSDYNENDKMSKDLVINMNKNKTNNINIEINDDKINIIINKMIKIDINSINNSLTINKHNININCSREKLIVNTNNNIKNHFVNLTSRNLNNEEFKIKNKMSLFSNLNNNYNLSSRSLDNRKDYSNIFGLINSEKSNINIFNEDKKEDKKIEINKGFNNSQDNIKNNKNIKIFKPKRIPKLNIINKNSKALLNSNNSFIKKVNPKYIKEESNKEEILKINCHVIKPYKVSFSLDIEIYTKISQLKKLIFEELIKKNNNFKSFNITSFYLMKDYTFIQESGIVNESNLSNEDDIYIVFKNDKE